MEQTQLDFVYLAGFFDGEGSISVFIHDTWCGTSNVYVQVSVGQGVLAPLECYREYFGGNIHKVKNAKKDFWNWVSRAGAAKTALECLLPYLRQKRSRAEIALKILDIDLRDNPSRREEKWALAKEIADLNARTRKEPTRFDSELNSAGEREEFASWKNARKAEGGIR